LECDCKTIGILREVLYTISQKWINEYTFLKVRGNLERFARSLSKDAELKVAYNVLESVVETIFWILKRK
jgi:hypothetical protein